MILFAIAAALLQAAPPPPPPATAAAVPAAQLALARQVVEQLRLRDTVLASLPAMKPLIAQQAMAAVDQPGSPFAAYAGDDAKKRQLAQIVGEEFVKAFEQQASVFEDAMAQAYARRMTTADLSALLAFLKTPAGVKWASIQPDITRDGQQIGAGIGTVAGMKASAAALERAKTEIK